MRSSEREFRIHELFFSTTDIHGKITSGNEVFARISGYSPEELISRPHSVIRHPDMPRAVFRILWERIEQGGSIAAYVKNRAKDGTYYWVLALVSPIDDGYLSVRFKPTTSLLETVDALYRKVRAAEIEREESGCKKEDVIGSSLALLLSELHRLGYQTYDEFIERALFAELGNRKLLSESTGSRETTPNDGKNHVVANLAHSAATVLGTILDRQTEFLTLDEKVEDTIEFVSTLSEGVQLASLNLAVRSARNGTTGAPIAIIAEWMNTGAGKLEAELTDRMEPMRAEMSKVRRGLFSLAASQLQIEMVQYFIVEMGRLTTEVRGYDEAEGLRLMRLLVSSAHRTLIESLSDLAHLKSALAQQSQTFASLSREVVGLGLAYVSGKVESVQLPDADSLQVLLNEVMQRISDGKAKLEQLEDQFALAERFFSDFMSNRDLLIGTCEELLGACVPLHKPSLC